MINAQEIFKKCSLSMRLYISANLYIKEALLNVVHNNIYEPQVTAIPSGSAALYTFLQNNKSKIQKSQHLKTHQKSILLPTSCQTVDSASLDISLIRFLIQTFNGIKNANNDWKKPAPTDQTLCAYVFRAADFRNQICHDNDVDKLDEMKFEKRWKDLKEILQGLKYFKSIEPLRTETLEFDKLEWVIFEEFVGHLRSYKKECLNESYQDDYIQRRFYVDRKRNNIEKTSDIVIESDLENIIINNDCVMIYAEAGMGKSSSAKRIKKEWCNENILRDLNILYFDSKKMNKKLKVQSHAAPLYFSDLGYYLKKNGRTEDDLSIYSCVKTTIEKLVILIDGIDEFPVKDLVTANYVDELERKVKNNEKINAGDTIVAIYFGFLFPSTKICLLGRNNEFERLKEFLSHNKNRRIKDLELLKFDDANVREYTCLSICKQQSNGQRNCTSACKDIYEKIKDIELCKIPTDLNSLIKLHKENPKENIGRITRTKLIIATILNRLNEHINRKNYFPCKTFGKIRKQNDFSNYLEGIRTSGEISFKSLLRNNIAVQVEEDQDTNGILFFKYENQVSIERKTLEDLDLFYIRDFNYYFILEPHHTLNIEFLCACYLFSHPDEWDSILKLELDRKLVIISFIAGLHADDYFTKDFVLNVLNTSSYSLEQFFSWMYNVEDVHESLPNGGYGYKCWYGLMGNQKLFLPIFLIDSISHEVKIPPTLIPKTIVCFGGYDLSFEWYDMRYFKYNFITKQLDKLNIELFLKKFSKFRFMIKGSIDIWNDDEFDRLNQYGTNNLITFRLNRLGIHRSPDTCFRSNFNVNTLELWDVSTLECVDMILSALSPPPTNTSPSNPKPALKCKQLYIRDNFEDFNSQQIEKMFSLLCGVVDYIRLHSSFFTDEQLSILENVERNSHKHINIQLSYVKFNCVFCLPHLGKRHLLMYRVNYDEKITDNDLINLSKHISPGYCKNLNNYKIIFPHVPFVRKENYMQDVEQSLYLNFCRCDFRNVSPDVFANTFSLISSLSCVDNDDNSVIPRSHWSSLSEKKDCQINEMRIWWPQPENYEHFVNIKTRVSQFICESKDDLEQLLNHIVNNQHIQLNKQIKVFVVKFDFCNWDDYKEFTLFSERTIEEYKDNCNSDNLHLDNISLPFHESDQHMMLWCCEISLLYHDKTELCVTNTYNHSESFIEDIENELSAIRIIGEIVYFKVVKNTFAHEQQL